MVEIRAFDGIVYDLDKTGGADDVLAPPYDVISPEEQDRLYSKHPNNVVRLILGKTSQKDADNDNRYTRSKADLDKWLDEGIVRPYGRPAIFLYSQEFSIDGGAPQIRTGFVCRLKIEPFGEGKVFPHERTLSGPKTDRLNLTRACRMNFSQVFGLYSDPDKALDELFSGIMSRQKPLVESDQEGTVHRMWPIEDEESIARIAAFLSDKDMVIADGHHRYETAVNYRNERRAQENGVPGDYDYVLMFLSNIHGEGFTVLPTHRFVLQTDVTAEDAIKTLSGDFEIRQEKTIDKAGLPAFMEELKAAGKKAVSFGMYTGSGAMRLISLKADAPRPAPPGVEKIKLLGELDVTILQELVLDKALGVTRAKVEAGGHIYYTISGEAAMDKVDSGEAKMAFLMNPTEIGQVMDIAKGGGTMPQKSTYFYPKLISGLVFNPL